MNESKVIMANPDSNKSNNIEENTLAILNNSISKKLFTKREVNNKNKIKIRLPGIDLVRILAMYGILIHHLIVFGNLKKKYKKYPEIYLINILTVWHVSSFALISGIIGYKTNKYSNLLYLWLSVLFYSVGIYLIVKKYRPNWVPKNELLYQYFFPVIFHKYWYFTQYFGMYLFLPVINKGIEMLTKKELKILVISIFNIYITWHDILNPKFDSFKMGGGYSVLYLLIVYIAGTYIGKYTIKLIGFKKFIFCLISIFVYISSSLLCYYLSMYHLDKKIKNINKYKMKIVILLKQLFVDRINSFPMIFQTFSITLFFIQIKYNKYLTKVITFFGPLTFGIYLIHNHILIKHKIIGSLFKNESTNLSLNIIIKLMILRALIIFGICIIIEYIRHLIFKFCKIKNICIFIEKKIFQIFS